jgi:hypothetical protein
MIVVLFSWRCNWEFVGFMVIREDEGGIRKGNYLFFRLLIII